VVDTINTRPVGDYNSGGRALLNLVVIGVDSLDEFMLTGLTLDIIRLQSAEVFARVLSQILFRILARMHLMISFHFFSMSLRLAYAFYNHTSRLSSRWLRSMLICRTLWSFGYTKRKYDSILL
jgi:hypothetical protein